jgi:hypothetical protein
MKAKKILAGACASLMLAMTTVSAVSAAAAVKVTVGNATAKAGEKFSVTIDLADIPTDGINACDFGVKYDSSALTITGVTAGALAKADTASLDGVNALETNIEAGLVSIIYGLGATESSNYMTGSGTFVTLEGTVSKTAAAGKYDLEVVAVDRLADPSGTATNNEIIFGNLAADNTTCTVYSPTIVNGYVEVTGDTTAVTTTTTKVTTVTTTTTAVQPTTEAPSIGKASLLGDVNLDTKAGTATDLVQLSKYLVNGTIFPLSAESLANADVDQNGKITSVDASTLIEVVTGNIKLS